MVNEDIWGRFIGVESSDKKENGYSWICLGLPKWSVIQRLQVGSKLQVGYMSFLHRLSRPARNFPSLHSHCVIASAEFRLLYVVRTCLALKSLGKRPPKPTCWIESDNVHISADGYSFCGRTIDFWLLTMVRCSPPNKRRLSCCQTRRLTGSPTFGVCCADSLK